MKPVIRLENITKKIGKTQILDHISLHIQKWQVYGFLGPNGAWKNTTMKTILWIISPTFGSVEILSELPTDISVQSKIGFMPENTYLYKYLTGDEFLDFNGKFYNLSQEKLEERKNWVLNKVGLTHAKSKRLNTYSKWMLQRIGLAQSILHDPDIIFLDEPMSGLDPIGRKMVKDLLLELKKMGKTIFFNTHILSDVEAICDSFGIICEWKLVADMKINELSVPLEDFFMQKIEQYSTRNYTE